MAAALVTLASCGTPPSPDSIVRGTVQVEVFQDHAYYPHALVEEFRQFNVELAPTEGRVLETAVIARVEWEITKVEPECNVVIALWHTAQWYNYARAGDGDLQNFIPNWWGLAQDANLEIQEPPLHLRQSPTRLLDVFTIAMPVREGRALTAWYVRGPLNSADLSNVEAYIVYGCNGGDRFKVARATLTEVIPAMAGRESASAAGK